MKNFLAMNHMKIKVVSIFLTIHEYYININVTNMQQLFYKQILGVIFGYIAYIIFGNIFNLTYSFYNIFQKS